TRWPRDWSSDVCSSDLVDGRRRPAPAHGLEDQRSLAAPASGRSRYPLAFSAGMTSSPSPGPSGTELMGLGALLAGAVVAPILLRSEERRVGKECGAVWG